MFLQCNTKFQGSRDGDKPLLSRKVEDSSDSNSPLFFPILRSLYGLLSLFLIDINDVSRVQQYSKQESGRRFR